MFNVLLSVFIWSLVLLVAFTWRGLVDYRDDRDWDDLWGYIDKEFHRYMTFVITIIFGLILLIWGTKGLFDWLWG